MDTCQETVLKNQGKEVVVVIGEQMVVEETAEVAMEIVEIVAVTATTVEMEEVAATETRGREAAAGGADLVRSMF